MQFKDAGSSLRDTLDHLVVDTPASLVADVGFDIAAWVIV